MGKNVGIRRRQLRDNTHQKSLQITQNSYLIFTKLLKKQNTMHNKDPHALARIILIKEA